MKILIACIGNIFLGDDGFGVEVARRLAFRTLPPEVIVKDFGIRGFDLAYALMGPHDLTILVDACARGFLPGTVFLMEPDPIESQPGPASLDLHGMNPTNVLRMVKSLGGTPGRILIVGCEPAELGSEHDGQLGLSEPVEAAVDEGISVIESLVSRILDGEPIEMSVLQGEG
ncbi:MAG TPA: hydrogenase maturation protease [Bryobacteraceae bacterium]|jgi:hydrogenase maturation protease|nr:hydrogenase maturation protease [Bryobacteraceae bacterium]